MKIVTSQILINKYGPTVLDMVKRLGNDIEILPTNNCNDAKKYIDTINDDILIFGGPDVIQFFTLLNPANDPDSTVFSDAPYACTADQSNLIPNKVVSRLPDEQINGTVDFIDKMTMAQMGFLKISSESISWFNIVASVWQGIGNYMSTTFKMEGSQHVVPPVTFDNLPEADILNRKYALLNLHGGKNTPFFYGQQNGIYPVALKPRLGDFKNTLMFSEACYGCYLDGRDKNMSIPLMALYSGAIGVVGSTEVAYGNANSPPKCADLLALKFYNHVISGKTLGESFKFAKIDFASETIQQSGSLDPESKKTLLSFNLFANPVLIV